MIDTSPYHEKLELLKEYMDVWIEQRMKFDWLIWMHKETGLLFYYNYGYITFDEFLKQKTNV